MSEEEVCIKTTIKQPRELWRLVRQEAVSKGKTNDEILTEILKKHYGVGEVSKKHWNVISSKIAEALKEAR